jgi:RNA polymerase sigma factor (sigma-70 family)
MALLPAKLALHDVRDVEALCAGILRRNGATWSEADREDALSYLIAEAWELSERYDTKHGISFSNYLTRRLPGRLVDWYRKRFGDSRYQNRAELVPLDTSGAEEISDGTAFAEAVVESQAFADMRALLSPRGREILDTVAKPIADGAPLDALALDLGISRRQISRRLDDLRDEMDALMRADLGLDEWATPDEVVEALHALDENTDERNV